MRAVLVLSIVIMLGVGSTYLAQEPAPTIITQIDDAIHPLERVRRSTFMLSLPDYYITGSAVLVGRQNLNNGMYRYRALTAFHLMRNMSKAFTKDKSKASHKLELIFQPTFHGETLRINLLLDDLDWANPMEDWASFTFDMPHKITCAEVATKEEFEAIKPFEKIYAVGCGGSYGQMCKVGIIGATHNEHQDLQGQNTKSKWPWDKHPHRFFRPYINVWYGDSGGGIFNKEGKLIGIINAFGILQKGWDIIPVAHSTIALKTYLVKDVVSASKDFFRIED